MDFDKFLGGVGTGTFSANSVTGSIREIRQNGQTGDTFSIETFSFESKASADDVIWTTDQSFQFNKNRTYEFNLNATFDSSTLAYSDLTPGTFNSTSSNPNIFGTSTINISAVPEPRTIGLLSAGAAGLVFRRRRRKNSQDNSEEESADIA